MGPGTRFFPYQWVQLQTYESRTLLFMTSLQYHCILGFAKVKTLHPREKIMSKRIEKDAGCACKTITGPIPEISLNQHKTKQAKLPACKELMLIHPSQTFSTGRKD